VPTSRLLDAAQGPLHPAARETLLAALDAGWADPRRLYAEGRRARALLDEAREIIATGLRVRPPELSFHGSGPQALSCGLSGLLHARRRRGRTLVASAVEHSVVLTAGRARAALDPADALVEVPVDDTGRVALDRWADAVAVAGVAVAALQHANGEVGTLQPLSEAYAAARRAEVPLLCDAQASLGRVDPPRAADAVAGTAASFGGPPAVGLLVVREGTRFALPGRRREAEHGRADTDPWVPLVLAAAEAWRQVEAAREEEARDAYDLIARLRDDVAALDGLEVVGHPTVRLPHVLTASALYVDGEALVHELARRGYLVASGSACTASTLEPSHVLAAMGALTHGNVRVTLPLAAVSPDRAEACAGLPAAVAEIVAAARESVREPVEALTAGDEAVLDARGTVCPQPVIDLARWWRAHPQRERVRLLADDEAARVDVPAWCRMTGHELHAVTELPEGGTAYDVGSREPA
jgi:cysteine desulfurase